MRRFFAEVNLENNTVVFSEETYKHIKVLRLNVSENFEVVSNGKSYLCSVTNIHPFEASVSGEIGSESNRELQFSLSLVCPLLKRGNFELVLQKCVELGVKDIYPFISSRVIKRVSKDEFESKRIRYEKIIEGACEQSNRSVVPTLHELIELKDLENIDAKVKFIAYEDEAIKGEMIPDIDVYKNDKVMCLVGPEGGFSRDEVNRCIEYGYKPVSLGKRILRAETAIMYMLSVTSYKGEKK